MIPTSNQIDKGRTPWFRFNDSADGEGYDRYYSNSVEKSSDAVAGIVKDEVSRLAAVYNETD
jgi:hypothetical protein